MPIRAASLAVACVLIHSAAVAQGDPRPLSTLSTLAELEAAGATIGTIRVSTQNVFDLADPREDHTLFRWVNQLHIPTRPEVIAQTLLFRTGDRVSLRVFEETERLLRGNRYLGDVQFRPIELHDGNVVDIEVMTRDTWSLQPGLGLSRAGGKNTTRLGIAEYNLFGSGSTLAVGRVSDADRTSTGFRFGNNNAFGTRTAIAYGHASNSDGKRDEASLVRPFYELDARWAAGIKATSDDRIESIYNAGLVASQYRHREDAAEVFAGWSRGLVDGWVQRWSVGLTLQDDAYAVDAGLTAPPTLPDDRRLVGPFLRYQLIEERYEREQNRNLIGRPEFFALGLAASLQLGYAATALGSTENALLYAASVGRGFQPTEEQTLLASAALTGQFSAGEVSHQKAGVQAQYYLPHRPHRVFYAGLSIDAATRVDTAEELLLGGDNGLRGYPLRYQSGTRRVLLTLEERHYTDLYLWRLFRIGAAAFFDVGRAWGGSNVNAANPGWLSDAGVGLRIASLRSAFSDVLHVDLAFPLDGTPEIEKVQLVVRAKATF